MQPLVLWLHSMKWHRDTRIEQINASLQPKNKLGWSWFYNATDWNIACIPFFLSLRQHLSCITFLQLARSRFDRQAIMVWYHPAKHNRNKIRYQKVKHKSKIFLSSAIIVRKKCIENLPVSRDSSRHRFEWVVLIHLNAPSSTQSSKGCNRSALQYSVFCMFSKIHDVSWVWKLILVENMHLPPLQHSHQHYYWAARSRYQDCPFDMQHKAEWNHSTKRINSTYCEPNKMQIPTALLMASLRWQQVHAYKAWLAFASLKLTSAPLWMSFFASHNRPW